MFIKLRRNIVMLKFNKFIFSLLFIFWDIGLIKGFYFKKYIKVFLNYKIGGKPIFNKVIFFSNINNKSVFNINNFFNNFFLNFILVWTNLGLMLFKDVIKKRLGGFLFCKFI